MTDQPDHRETHRPQSADTSPILKNPPRCVFCGYDLRGSTRDGVCSECGQPNAESFEDARWALSPKKLRFMRRASLCFLIPCVFSVVGSALYPYVLLSGGAFGIARFVRYGETLGLLAAIYGLFILTSPPARRFMRDPSRRFRQTLRCMLFIWIFTLAACIPLTACVMALTTSDLGICLAMIGYPLVFLLTGLSLLVLPPAMLIYLANLHRSAGAGRAAIWCRLAGLLVGFLNASFVIVFLGHGFRYQRYFEVVFPWQNGPGAIPVSHLSIYANVVGFGIPTMIYILAAWTFYQTYRAAVPSTAD